MNGTGNRIIEAETLGGFLGEINREYGASFPEQLPGESLVGRIWRAPVDVENHIRRQESQRTETYVAYINSPVPIFSSGQKEGLKLKSITITITLNR